MFSPRHILISFVLLSCLFTAGCTSFFHAESGSANTTEKSPQSNARYQVTIAQPDARSDFIRMDSDVYNVGEVVEFKVINNDLLPLECSHAPPGFAVNFQTGNGKWAVKKGTEEPAKGNTSSLQKGESTPAYRFVSSGWEPGRYRIVSDCGPEHDILIRALPTPIPTVTQNQTPVICPPSQPLNKTLWITIDPFDNPGASHAFTIHGTTNIPAGQELFYSIFTVQSYSQNRSFAREGSFTTMVEAGNCGINQWSASGEIQATGEFFIGISDAGRKAVTVKRFTVSPS
jgi:hypothetical protein